MRMRDIFTPEHLALRKAHNRRSALIFGQCPPALRKRVREAFGWQCEYCGYRTTPECGARKAVKGCYSGPYLVGVDRIVPSTLGGAYLADNVTLACNVCNVKKGAKTDFIGPVRSLADMEASHV